MQLLNAAAGFTSKRNDLKDIYLTFIRSIVEQSAVVWHSGLSSKNKKDIERVQKAAVRVIMGNKYQGYEQALKFLKLDSLKERRVKMALTFAKRSLKLEHFSKLFPLNESNHLMSMRSSERYVVSYSNTQRRERSAIPFLQRLLNDDYAKQKKDLSKLLRVNNGVCKNAPITY